MVDLKRQYRKHKSELDEAILNVMDSALFINGPEVKLFAEDIRQYLGVKYAVPCASGTDALQLALMAIGVQPGDEVITTPFTFVATAETIALLGAKPVYVDIDKKTYNLDPALIKSAITEKTRAIIPVHLYGQPAAMEEIMAIAKTKGLTVIEDAAQAMGAKYHGKPVCTFGDMGCISFFPSKNLGAAGDAGMVVTNDEALAEKLKMIANHGSNVRYHHEMLGVNSRLDTIQAAILRIKLRYLDQWNDARRKCAAYYSEKLENLPVVTPFETENTRHIYHQYTILVENRDGLRSFLQESGIPSAIHYPIPLHLQPAFANLPGSGKWDLPIAEKTAEKVISLPMHPELTPEEQDFVVKTIKDFLTT